MSSLHQHLDRGFIDSHSALGLQLLESEIPFGRAGRRDQVDRLIPPAEDAYPSFFSFARCALSKRC